MRIISIVTDMPVIYIPAPMVIPIPTVPHKPAAVVTPMVFSFFMKMTPAPKKPMAETTEAATREASISIPSMASTSKNPYFETIIIKAEARDTSICVLTPAFLLLFSLSIPMREPQSAATTILKRYDHSGEFIIFTTKLFIKLLY